MAISMIFAASCGGSAGPPSATALRDALFEAEDVPIDGSWAIDEEETHQFVPACDVERFILRSEPLADVERVYKDDEVDRGPSPDDLAPLDPDRVDSIAVRLLTFDDADSFAEQLEEELDECAEETGESSASLGTDSAVITTVRRVDDRELPVDSRLDAMTWNQISAFSVGDTAAVSPSISELFVDGHVVGLVRSSGIGRADLTSIEPRGLVGQGMYTASDEVIRDLLERL